MTVVTRCVATKSFSTAALKPASLLYEPAPEVPPFRYRCSQYSPDVRNVLFPLIA